MPEELREGLAPSGEGDDLVWRRLWERWSQPMTQDALAAVDPRRKTLLRPAPMANGEAEPATGSAALEKDTRVENTSKRRLPHRLGPPRRLHRPGPPRLLHQLEPLTGTIVPLLGMKRRPARLKSCQRLASRPQRQVETGRRFQKGNSLACAGFPSLLPLKRGRIAKRSPLRLSAPPNAPLHVKRKGLLCKKSTGICRAGTLHAGTCGLSMNPLPGLFMWKLRPVQLPNPRFVVPSWTLNSTLNRFAQTWPTQKTRRRACCARSLFVLRRPGRSRSSRIGTTDDAPIEGLAPPHGSAQRPRVWSYWPHDRRLRRLPDPRHPDACTPSGASRRIPLMGRGACQTFHRS